MPGLGWVVLLCASHHAGLLVVFVLLSASAVLCGSHAVREQAQRNAVLGSGQDGLSQCGQSWGQSQASLRDSVLLLL